MQISTHSPQEAPTKERTESHCQSRCPVCSGSLIPLHNSYRCSRCSHHLCVGCEKIEIYSTGGDGTFRGEAASARRCRDPSGPERHLPGYTWRTGERDRQRRG